jgi:hypothetical protein
MLQLIPKSLQIAYPEMLSDIHTEVMTEYEKSMQKSMGKKMERQHEVLSVRILLRCPFVRCVPLNAAIGCKFSNY